MRARDVEVGRTYVVLVPHRLPASRYPDRFEPGTAHWDALWLAGARFRFTVTAVDRTASPPTAEGLRITERSHTVMVLTAEQVAGLGLPPGDEYRMLGMLVDTDDRPVYLPDIEPLTVPVRWLRSPDDPHLDPRTHRDADRYPYI
ncbi:hypothetical protein AB0H00_30065 [Nocardia sp. NPDC023852]|uniref:hypothetical protein n=1 Tax=Nocardia sp. NPDC023852 TaxID=3154697 RepID=UPI0033FDB7CF